MVPPQGHDSTPDEVEPAPDVDVHEDGEAPEERVFREGGISYLHIPTKNPYESGIFYQAVFGWEIAGDPAHPSFQDSTGHVVGRWVTDLQVSPEESGVLPYVHVDSVDSVLDRVAENGGEISRMPFQEGDVWVATFRDPSGTVVGIWQRGPR